MNKTITDFLDELPAERKAIIEQLHKVIITGDAGVVPAIKPMMGKEMILYEEACTMKYALASVQKHLSFHCLPMYMKPELYAKFRTMLPLAKFQKGCINFSSAEELPASSLKEIIADCKPINLAAVLSARKK